MVYDLVLPLGVQSLTIEKQLKQICSSSHGFQDRKCQREPKGTKDLTDYFLAHLIQKVIRAIAISLCLSSAC